MADEKTFTQEQLDAIIKERLAKEKAKSDAAFAEKEKELAAREFNLKAKETLTEKGIPLEYLEALNTSTPDAFNKSLELLESKLKTNTTAPDAPKINTGGKHNPDGSSAVEGDIRAAMGLK